MTQTCSDKAQKVLQTTEKHIDFFPISAVRDARNIQEELIPELLNRVNFAIEQAETLPNDYMGHIFALYLLAEFRVRDAYEPIIRIYSLSEKALDFLGDILTDGLDSIAASVAMGRYTELLAIFENRTLYEFARLSALSAIEIQIHNGLVDRSEIVTKLKESLQNAIREEDSIAVTALASTVCILKINELVDMVRPTFEGDLIQPFLIDRITFEQILQRESTYGKSQNERLVSTAEESMSWWSCYKGKRKIQRNELCPCTSGLKYKNCCIR